jgi:hypothetical protein
MEKVVKADLLQGVFPCEKVGNPFSIHLHALMNKAIFVYKFVSMIRTCNLGYVY